MVNLITRMNNVEIIWDSVESDTFYGDFMVKSVWRYAFSELRL